MTTPRDEPQQHALRCETCEHNKTSEHSEEVEPGFVGKGSRYSDNGGVWCEVPNQYGEHWINSFPYDERGCASHIANTDAQNKAEGVAQISSYNYIKDIAAAKGMSFYDLVDLVVDDLKAQARIDAVVKEIERRIAAANAMNAYPFLSAYEAIALLKEGVGK